MTAMPKDLGKYLYPACVLAAAVLALAGLAVLTAASTFEGYITALLLFALGGVAVCGAWEVKAKDARPDAGNPPPGDLLRSGE